MLRQILAVSGALSLALLLPVSAGAHDAWVAERWGELGVVYGHGAGDAQYDPSHIPQAFACAEDGTATPVAIDTRKKHTILRPEGEPAAVALTFDNGYGTEKTDGVEATRIRTAE